MPYASVFILSRLCDTTRAKEGLSFTEQSLHWISMAGHTDRQFGGQMVPTLASVPAVAYKVHSAASTLCRYTPNERQDIFSHSPPLTSDPQRSDRA